MTKEQFLDITKWQRETFSLATPLSKARHLKEEIDELIMEIMTNSADVNEEYADCFILLAGAAYLSGLSYETIVSEIDRKMSINKNRHWQEPDENGVVRHEAKS